MIRSAEHVAFEAAMERGARDAELRWIAEISRCISLDLERRGR